MDRLRRLDALFAERVLGCKVIWHGGSPCCNCNGDHAEDYGYQELKPYTRSLDAAWEGVPRMYEVNLYWQGGSIARVKYAVDIGIVDAADHADHPAEALVLACLRAVGCREEELQ